MSRETTRLRPPSQTTSAADPIESPNASSNHLREQSAAFGQVAREAHEQCEKGPDAQKALHARRNVSAQ